MGCLRKVRCKRENLKKKPWNLSTPANFFFFFFNRAFRKGFLSWVMKRRKGDRGKAMRCLVSLRSIVPGIFKSICNTWKSRGQRDWKQLRREEEKEIMSFLLRTETLPSTATKMNPTSTEKSNQLTLTHILLFFSYSWLVWIEVLMQEELTYTTPPSSKLAVFVRRRWWKETIFKDI